MRRESRLSDPPGRIYVVENLKHLEKLPPGKRSWWCVEPSAVPGEVCAIYVKKRGISLLFRFLRVSSSQELFCSLYRLRTGDIKILAKLDQPVSFRELRAHRTLRSLPAVASSFQKRSFRLDQPYHLAVTELFDWKEIPPSSGGS